MALQRATVFAITDKPPNLKLRYTEQFSLETWCTLYLVLIVCVNLTAICNGGSRRTGKECDCTCILNNNNQMIHCYNYRSAKDQNFTCSWNCIYSVTICTKENIMSAVKYKTLASVAVLTSALCLTLQCSAYSLSLWVVLISINIVTEAVNTCMYLHTYSLQMIRHLTPSCRQV